MRTISQLMDLHGRAGLVTGGTGHIGRVICEGLAEMGARVAVLDLDLAKCAEHAAALAERYGVETMPLALDLSDDDAVKEIPAILKERWPGLDLLVNCAALVASSQLRGWSVPFVDQELDAWRAGLEVNLTAVFNVCQSFSSLLAESGTGSIVNIGSIYGMVGPDMGLYEGTEMANVASYAASKAGVLQLTRWLATVLAPAVRVNSVSLGGVWRNQPEAFRDSYVRRTPLGRMATEEDVKGAVVYLASEMSCYVTGHNLVIDGGWTAW